MAYVLLNEINRIQDDPESYQVPGDWIMQVLAGTQKRLLDTLLTQEHLRVPVRIYYPDRRSLKGDHPVTLFIHGGGFLYGSVEEYHIMVSKLARVTGRIFVSVEYRLAPEYPFPAALEDCYAVYSWLQENGRSIGADTTRIGVMGDSAGGNLATVITLLCRDRGKAQPHHQVLLYPGVSFLETPSPSREYFGKNPDKNYVLTEAFLRKVKSFYMGEMKDERHPYLSPLEARLGPELAPALIITAECDPLRDDGRAYADRLRESGVKVVYLEYSGMIHGFMSFHMILREAVDAMKYIRRYSEGI
jgi:acetyl esterase